jgi:hypothetical protein
MVGPSLGIDEDFDHQGLTEKNERRNPGKETGDEQPGRGDPDRGREIGGDDKRGTW